MDSSDAGTWEPFFDGNMSTNTGFHDELSDVVDLGRGYWRRLKPYEQILKAKAVLASDPTNDRAARKLSLLQAAEAQHG